MLAASSRKCNVIVWRPSACVSRRRTHCVSPGGSMWCGQRNVHFGLTIRRTGIYLLLNAIVMRLPALAVL